MNKPPALRFMLGVVILLSFVRVTHAGGSDIVTLKDFPDFAVAGKPLNLTFAVWAPSLEPLANFQPKAHATLCPRWCSSGLAPQLRNATETRGVVANASVKPGATTGEYTAELILPEPGDWVIAIDTEYAGASTLPPLKLIAPGTPAPTPFSPAARGRRLFTAKAATRAIFVKTWAQSMARI